MFSFITPLRTAAAVAVLALGGNAGIAVAATNSHGHTKNNKHQVHKAKHHPKKHTKHTKHTKQTKAAAAKATYRKVTAAKAAAAKAAAAKAAAAKAATTTPTTTTTPTVTIPTITTPTITTPTITTPTTTTPTAVTPPVTTAAATPVGIPGSWSLKLDSEFNTSSLNTSIWRSGWFGTGVTDSPGDGGICNSSSNVTFPGDGSMHLNLTATPSTCQGGQTYPYTGALVDSNPADGRSSGGYQYTYGVLEARVYVSGNGSDVYNWPAVWADGQSWPNDGEDDLMEALSGQVCWHFHDPLGGPGGCDTSITAGWHTFASDWQPGSVSYYYDGTEVGSINTGITSSPMYIILSNGAAIGEAGTTPATMQVQYVRVWQS